MKQFVAEEALRTGKSAAAVSNAIYRGAAAYRHLKKRRVNARVVFVQIANSR